MTLHDQPQTLPQLLATSAAEYGDRVALRSRSKSLFSELTYTQLLDHSQRFALWLDEEHAVGFADHVVIISPNSPEWVVATFGTTMLGATIVPVHPSVSQDQLVDIFYQVKPRAIFCAWNVIPAVHAALAANVQEAPIIDLATLPATLSDYTPIAPALLEDIAPQSGDRAVVVWTSGTTGALKGVVLTHLNLISNTLAFREAVPFSSDDRLFSVLPLAHIFEFNVGMLVPLSQGAEITYPAVKEDLVEAFFEVAPTVLVAVPRLLEKLAAWGEVRLEHLSPLRLVIAGGAALPVSLAERIESMGVPTLQGYGLSETGPVISVNRIGANRIGSVGKPLSSVRLQLRNDEILVRGPSVAQAYLSRQGEIPLSCEMGWFRTGDLGRISKDGFLFITGRKKDILALSTGEKIAPLPIEEALESIPGIAQAMAIGEGRKHVAAILTLEDPNYMRRPNAPAELKAGIAAALTHLPSNHQVRTYIVISHPFSIAEGELTPTFKLCRDVILKKYAEQIDDLYNRLNY